MTRAMLGSYPAQWVHRNNFVTAPKLILVRKGSMRYVLEGTPFDLEPGNLFLRPAWTRSDWSVSRNGNCEFIFCECDPGTIPWSSPLVVRDAAGWAAASLDRIHFLHQLETPESGLEAEAELKKVVGGFLCRAAEDAGGRSPDRGKAATPSDSALQEAMAHLCRNYARPEVIGGLARRVGMSENHFRLLFKRKFGMSAQQFVLTLRMRAARHYLAQSPVAIKEVAAAVGYDDPLYFSRTYAKFWGHPPSDDRGVLTRQDRPPLAG